MSNIYKERQTFSDKPSRNNFDLSYTNNFTTKLCQITPILTKEVIPGDDFEMDIASGIRAMPLVFPIQTPVQVELEAYLVPYRVIWDDWKDFAFNNKKRVVPYLHLPYTEASKIGTGTLADYLGVPTTFAGRYGAAFSLSFRGSQNITVQTTHMNPTGYEQIDSAITPTDPDQITISNRASDSPDYIRPYVVPAGSPVFLPSNTAMTPYYQGLLSLPFSYGITKLQLNNIANISDGTYHIYFSVVQKTTDFDGRLVDANSPFVGSVVNPIDLVVTSGVGEIDFTDYTGMLEHLIGQYGEIRLFLFESSLDLAGFIVFDYDPSAQANNLPFIGSPCAAHTNQNIVGDIPANLNPFCVQEGETVPAIPLFIAPFRAYHAIYNRYKRNNIINPLRINGEIEYNEYCITKASGADSDTPLNLMNRNYELDFLTSCYTSPQQGIAPLVGVTPTEDPLTQKKSMVLHMKDVATQQDYDMEIDVDEDGDFTGISSYSAGTPVANLLTIQDMIKFGISISTFRSVNALQEWLQTNQRNGFRYEEQMFAHFGQDVSNIELQEPIFLGGHTTRLSVRTIDSTAKSEGMNLGDMAGQAYLADQTKHTIRFHSQEHGIVMVTMTLTPIPSYSQLLPKMFLKYNPLDFYSEKFQHIGLQPITYREAFPLQTFAAGDNLDDTFGYQRPYYDLIANVDEQHSRMRTDLQNFLITRTFGTRPQLSQSFVEADPKDLTNPFVDTAADADNFICQVYFDLKAKRPISRMAIERLEP